MTIAYLNGHYLPQEQAMVPAMDRGFIFGDGVYEVIPVYAGKIFRGKAHLTRLRYSLEQIQLPIALSDQALEAIFNELIQRNNGGDLSLYLQITRGPAPSREFSFPENISPTVFAYCSPLTPPTLETLQRGIAAITLPDLRWQRCDIKAITLLASVLMRQQAVDAGVQEAILINNGYAIEGSASNLFMVKNGTIQTPPLSQHLLGGITRELVLELARLHQLPIAEQPIPLNDLKQADEIWISSSTREIVPVLTIDQQTVGNGKAGPIWQQMIHHYQNFKKQL